MVHIFHQIFKEAMPPKSYNLRLGDKEVHTQQSQPRNNHKFLLVPKQRCSRLRPPQITCNFSWLFPPVVTTSSFLPDLSSLSQSNPPHPWGNNMVPDRPPLLCGPVNLLSKPNYFLTPYLYLPASAEDYVCLDVKFPDLQIFPLSDIRECCCRARVWSLSTWAPPLGL